MSQSPFFSIIIPTFNSEKTVAHAIESILRQTFSSVEILIMDGCSQDSTVLIAENFGDNRLRIFSTKDKGVYDAMNRGIDLSSGQWLYFMGSDDVLHGNNVLDDVFNAIDDSFDFIYGNVLFKQSKQIYSGESSLMKLMREQISICHQAVFYRRSLFDRIGKYNLDFFIHADYDFNVRCFRDRGINKRYIERTIAVFNEAGLSGTNSNADSYHTLLTKEYVDKFEDPVRLFLENKQLRSEMSVLRRSKLFRLRSFIFNKMRRLKGVICSRI